MCLWNTNVSLFPRWLYIFVRYYCCSHFKSTFLLCKLASDERHNQECQSVNASIYKTGIMIFSRSGIFNFTMVKQKHNNWYNCKAWFVVYHYSITCSNTIDKGITLSTTSTWVLSKMQQKTRKLLTSMLSFYNLYTSWFDYF